MKRSAVGFILILIGLAFLLRNMGWFPYFSFHLFAWPNIMFVLAIVFLLTGNPKPALVFVLIGGAFWARRYFYIDWELLWPVMLILLGIAFFIQQSGRSGTTDDNTVDETTIFSGNKRRFTSTDFRGGKTTTVFGGTKLDLQEAHLADDAVFDVFCLFGGVEIKAPEHWKINITATPLFGAIQDGRKSSDEDGPTLKITGLVMFGGVEIKT